MPATFRTARLSRFAILAVTGAAALSVAACGGASNNAKPTSANPTSLPSHLIVAVSIGQGQ